MKTYLKYICCAALVLVSAQAYAEGVAFPRYLQKGDEGRDVKLLQLTLNGDPDTIITDSGSGSPGFETDFYGERTKQAVIKFQRKHDLGSKLGFFTIYSGSIDEATRKFLNNQVKVDVSTLDEDELTNIRNDNFKKNVISTSTPFIQSVEPRTVENGDFITITGKNFTTANVNIVGNTYDKTSTTSPDGTTLKIKIRTSLQDMFNAQTDGYTGDQKDDIRSKIPKIPMFITVRNDNGISNAYQIYTKIK